MSDEERNKIWEEIEQKSPTLLKAFLSLKNEDELKAFFRDLMSERDLREFAMDSFHNLFWIRSVPIVLQNEILIYQIRAMTDFAILDRTPNLV